MITDLVEHGIHVGVAFGALCAAHGLGVVRERNRKPKPEPKYHPNLGCGCHHNLSFHNGLDGCRFVTEEFVRDKDGRIKRDKNREPLMTKIECSCQQYSGELPEDWWSRDAMKELDTGRGEIVIHTASGDPAIIYPEDEGRAGTVGGM